MIFLLDNYDSFTYMIADYLRQLGAEVLVERNDIVSVDEIGMLEPRAIVISPGPSTPDKSGITLDVIRHFHPHLPILGICLGYQAIGQFFGCRLVRSAVPVHGKTSAIRHSADGIFKGIPQNTRVMRYHSLNIAGFPDSLRLTAETAEGVPMAFQHTSLPLAGVQFHPESVLTAHGMELLRNWLEMYDLSRSSRLL